MFKILEFTSTSIFGGSWHIRQNAKGKEKEFNSIHDAKKEVEKMIQSGKSGSHKNYKRVSIQSGNPLIQGGITND